MKRLYITMLVIFATSVSFSHDTGKKNVTSVEVKIDASLAKDGELSHHYQILSWENFEGEPDTISPWGALTHSGIRLKYEYRKNRDTMTAVVRLLPFMDKHRSWCKDFARNDYTLAHEQRHFDIAAVVTNELAEEIRHTNFRLLDFASTIMKLHGKYIAKLEKMQEDYDLATAHGDNIVEQLAWNKRIAEQLNEQRLAFW